MRVYYGLEGFEPSSSRSALTIGNYDGVHRGHQEILAETVRLSRLAKVPAVVLTFEPHPLTIVSPDHAPQRLTSPEEKVACLGRAGVDAVVLARSEPELLGLEAEEFVERVVHQRFHPVHIVEGESFGFGRGRRGNVQLLRRWAAEFNCAVHVVKPVEIAIDKERFVVSSSMVRRLLSEGDVHRTALCLGRPYALLGQVVHGAHRGRELGFPTANVTPEDQLVPGEGVYAGIACVATGRFHAAISIGRSPTFSGDTVRVEAHLLDYSGDLYGQPIRLEFHRFLRAQRQFASVDDLTHQIAADIAAVRP